MYIYIDPSVYLSWVDPRYISPVTQLVRELFEEAPAVVARGGGRLHQHVVAHHKVERAASIAVLDGSEGRDAGRGCGGGGGGSNVVVVVVVDGGGIGAVVCAVGSGGVVGCSVGGAFAAAAGSTATLAALAAAAVASGCRKNALPVAVAATNPRGESGIDRRVERLGHVCDYAIQRQLRTRVQWGRLGAPLGRN